jgi:putative ABC transport system ATP-binding protein
MTVSTEVTMATAVHPQVLTPVLELRKASKVYPGSPPVRALDRVTLDVVEGEMVSIVGPSGSGKSTLLHLIGVLDRPSRGAVRVAGADLRMLRDPELSALRASRIGFVFQQFHLLEGLSALDNVAAGLIYRGIARTERRRQAAAALAQVGLAHRLRHRPSELSGGEKQRVAIARAVVGEPAIVLADEPTGNLDSATGAQVLALFRSLHVAGHTIVLITHDPQVAAAAPRTVGLRDAGLRRQAFPPDTANLLPGLLAATRTGLPPAGDDELVDDQINPKASPPTAWARGIGHLGPRRARGQRAGPGAGSALGASPAERRAAVASLSSIPS